MIIHSMTARFGCLDGETLDLHPGMNVLTIPNEGGKTTWLAFLTAMLYGIDTAERTTKSVLSAKEHYQPWAGGLMQGRLELEHNRRRIIIERTSTKRYPLREVKARDAQTGQLIPELCRDDCGVVLLGVERAVFERSALIAQGRLKPTAAPELEQQLSSLVTGEEEGSYDAAQKRLAAWRSDRSAPRKGGRLEQTKKELEQLTQQLEHQQRLAEQTDILQKKQTQLEEREQQLQKDLNTWKQEEQYRLFAACCEAKAHAEEIQQKIQKLSDPALPQLHELQTLRSRAGELADRAGAQDVENHRKWMFRTGLALAAIGFLSGMAVRLCMRSGTVAAAGVQLAAILVFAAGIVLSWKGYRARKHGQALHARRAALAAEQAALMQTVRAFSPTAEDENCIAAIDEAITCRQALDQALLQAQQAQESWQRLAPLMPDGEIKEPETLPSAGREQLRTQLEECSRSLSDCRLRMAVLQGSCLDAQQLQTKEERRVLLQSRCARLQQEIEAIDLAIQTLDTAQQSLRAQFAPTLTEQAGEILAQLTDSRYQAVTIDRTMALTARAKQEVVSRGSLWLSGGTADQLYLAVRLALCSLLLPEDAPIFLDDALVNFDDRRLTLALDYLRGMADNRQVVILSCQNREQELQAAISAAAIPTEEMLCC